MFMGQPDVSFHPLTLETFQTYIQVGTTSYNQHYLHLWEDNDPTPYLESSFTHQVLEKEMKDKNTDLYIIFSGGVPVGILKIVKDSPVDNYTSEETILLEKIYVLKEYSGKGIGKKAMGFVEDYGRKLNKKVLWLDTMKKGPAMQFYLKNGFEIHSEKLLGFHKVLEAEKPMYILIKSL